MRSVVTLSAVVLVSAVAVQASAQTPERQGSSLFQLLGGDLFGAERDSEAETTDSSDFNSGADPAIAAQAASELRTVADLQAARTSASQWMARGLDRLRLLNAARLAARSATGSPPAIQVAGSTASGSPGSQSAFSRPGASPTSPTTRSGRPLATPSNPFASPTPP